MRPQRHGARAPCAGQRVGALAGGRRAGGLSQQAARREPPAAASRRLPPPPLRSLLRWRPPNTRAQDGATLVGQEILDPPARYLTPYNCGQPSSQSEGPSAVPPPPPLVQVLSADCFHSFKRLMGKKAAEVAEEAARLGYRVGEGDRGEALVYR